MTARIAPAANSLQHRQQLAIDMVEAGAGLEDVLTLLCHVVEAEAQSLVFAGILLVDAEANCLRKGASPGLPDRYNDAVDGIGIAPDVGTCAAAAARREVVITPDIGADAGWDGIAHLPLGLGLVAAWSMPIIGSGGDVLGTFGTYFTECRAPSPDETALVGELVPIAARAIERHRTA